MRKRILNFLVPYLLKFQYFKNGELEYGFYIYSSPCSVHFLKHTWYRKLRLVFAFGNREWMWYL